MHVRISKRVDSSLPLDLGCFEWNGDAIEVRDRACGIVGNRACNWHPKPISVPSSRACQLPDTIHLQPQRFIPLAPIRVQLYAHGVWIKVIKVDLNFKQVLFSVGPTPTIGTPRSLAAFS